MSPKIGFQLLDGRRQPWLRPPEETRVASLKDPNRVDRARPKRVAIVVANPAISTTTGWPGGFWWSELTHPWLAFHERGYEVEVFSPEGGRCEADAMSDPRDASG